MRSVLLFLLCLPLCRCFSARGGGSARRQTRRQRPRRRPPPPRDPIVQQDQEVVILAKALAVIYQQGGTLGVLRRSEGMQKYRATTLVQAAVMASQGDRGMASGILNALLGSCCSCSSSRGNAQHNNDGDNDAGARQACALMRAYDALAEFLTPDLVALSLAYAATANAHERFQRQAVNFLKRAESLHGETTRSGSDTDILPSSSPDWSALNHTYNIQLLQDSDEFVVVSKPSGMVCYHAESSLRTEQTSKRKKAKDPSLESCLLKHGVPLSTLNQQGRGFVHRLDMGTSGCLVLAKTNQMHAILVARFFLRQVEKSYQAMVITRTEGQHVSLPDRGVVQLDIDGRPAMSKYRVQSSCGSLVKRIQVKTEQGRRHQVRLHCAEGLQTPILLDPLYGGLTILSQLSQKDNSDDGVDQQNEQQLVSLLSKQRSAQQFCLHADTLAIPSVGVRVEAPLPDWWQALEAQFCLI